MPEDAGKKRVIKGFLQQVSNGLGFIEDIWIEREVKLPGTDGEFIKARSISGQVISNLTELLNDDLKHSFEDGYFTFRFIAADPGSGKTALLGYLCEQIKVRPIYHNYSVIVSFSFNDLLSESGSQSFGVKFYSYILTQTLWCLLRNDTNLSSRTRSVAEDFLSKIIKADQFAQLKLSTDFKVGFIDQLNGHFGEKQANFEQLFFSLIDHISKSDLLTFVYLIDELDALPAHHEYVHDARSIIRALINRAFNSYYGQISLMTYVVGRADDIGTFIRGDAALERRVFDSIVGLARFRNDECERIKAKINDRIEGAYTGCKDFAQAWDEIQNIRLEPGAGKDFDSLGEFCKKYARKVLEVHEKYFRYFDQPHNIFEDKARQLVEIKSREKWRNYLGDCVLAELECIEKRDGYFDHNKWKKFHGNGEFSLLVSQTTTKVKGHAFDCYTELHHNNHCVARAFGEAKNYELLSSHLETFKQWLDDVGFSPSASNRNPPDLAIVIAPSCPSLLQRKLELKNIQFIESEKVIKPTSVKKDHTESSQSLEEKYIPNWIFPEPDTTRTAVNLNTADKNTLTAALKGTGIKKTTIDRLVNQRPYESLGVMVDKLKFTTAVRAKLMKLESDKKIVLT